MKKVTIFTVISLLLISLSCVSCDMIIGDDTETVKVSAVSDESKGLTVNVKINDNNSKALSLTNNTAPSKYKYEAVCTTNPSALGVTTTLTDLNVNAGVGKIQLMPGTWKITIYCYNSEGGLISKGESGEKVLSSAVTDVSISCKSVNGTANSSIVLQLGAPTITNGQVEIRYGKVASGIPSAASKVLSSGTANKDYQGDKTGYTQFSDTLTIAPEMYIMQLLYTDGTSPVSGQIFVFKAVEKTPVKVSGNFDYGEYVSPDIDIDVDPTELTVSIDDSAAPKFVASAKAGSADITGTYQWYVNGALQASATTDTFNFAPASNGMYAITCIVTGTVNGTALYGFETVTYEKTT